MSEALKQQEIQQAYSVADALAEAQSTYYPDEFLADLQASEDPADRVLFEDFIALNDVTTQNDETTMLLGQLDGALSDWEARSKESADAEKIKPALEWKENIDAIGLTDELIKKLVGAIISSPNPIDYLGKPFDANRPGHEPSFDHDKRIAESIRTKYPTSEAIVKAYSEALQSGDADQIASVAEDAQFLLEKGKLLVEQRKKAQTKAKQVEEAKARAVAISEHLEQDRDIPVETILQDVEKAILERDGEGEYDPRYTWTMVNQYREYLKDPSLDHKTEEDNARYFCAEFFVAEAERQAAKRSQAAKDTVAVGESSPGAQASVEANPADAALASTSAAPRAAVSVAPSTVEAAPEVAVDYRADAREHPEKYLTEGVSDTSIFTPPNDKANRAIRIEDLYHKDTEKPKLTSTRYPGMTFAYGNGADGNSWYDVAGSDKRLAILRGDTLTEVKDEPAPAVASEDVAAEPPVAGPEATPQPEVAAAAPLPYGELRAMMAQLSNDTTYLESLPSKKAARQKERDRWYTINKTYDADIAKIDADLKDYPANIKDQADTLSKQVGNPEYALALKDEFVGDDRRLALKLPEPTADASAIEAALAARTTNPSTDTEVQNTDAVADASQ